MRKSGLLWFALMVLLVAGIASCEKDIKTGLEGIVYRGPINPAAIDGVPNDEPFAADFTVYREFTPVAIFASVPPKRSGCLPDSTAPDPLCPGSKNH